jgi:hypothetical protein
VLLKIRKPGVHVFVQKSSFLIGEP